MSKNTSKSKAARNNQAATTVDAPGNPPPPPGTDSLVDPSDLIVSSNDKKLSELVGDIEMEVPKKNLLSLLNVHDETVTKLNDAIAVELGKSPDLAAVLDRSKGDIVRARAVEALASSDVAKAHVISEGWTAAALEAENPEEAFKAIAATQKSRLHWYETMTNRKKLELDDVASRNREIIQETVNELVKDLESSLKVEGIDPTMSDKILQRLADKVGLRFGEDVSDT